MIECPTCGCNNTEQAQRCEKCASPLLGIDLRCGLYTYGGTSNGQVLQRRYIITRELNSDFTGVKYLAEDAEEKKDVIIWALPVIAATAEDKIKSLSELCDSLNALSDEHILKVSGVYTKRNARYIVVEYFDGCSLEEKVESEGPLSLEQVLEIFSPVASSIDLAHGQGFIHGDICPANVLINSKGVIKLAYFAIGRKIKDLLSRISPKGKTEPSLYTAPEQLENAACSAQSDIYSLAACIYQGLCGKPFRRQFEELEQESGQLPQLNEKQNKVLLRSLSANPQDRHSSAVELLTELRGSTHVKIVEKDLTEPKQIGYERSLSNLKQKNQDWNREFEETINKLMADFKCEEQKHAEILHQTQAQARQQVEQLRVDYERKIEQLKAKIEATQAELTAALSEMDRKAEELVTEKRNSLQQSIEHEEAINKLIADVEWEKQKHAEMLSKAQTQIREQAEQELAVYEKKIEQLRTKIADTELAAVAALGQTDRNTEALTAEKEKALKQSREHEEAIRALITDIEKEKQQHLEILSQDKTKSIQQAEQQLVEYEEKIKQLEDKIAEEEAKLATAVSEANQKAEELALEKEKALQQSREYEETIKKLIADSEKEKQQHLDILEQAQTQAKEQVEQLKADYEKKIEQLRDTIADAEFAAAMSEAERNAEELAAEKEKALQKSREYEETIKKLIEDAEKEKQILADALSQTQTQVQGQTDQKRADYEKEIEKLKVKITETETELAAALEQAHRNSETLISEKEKALQKSKETLKNSSKPEFSIKAFAAVSIVAFGVTMGYLYIQAGNQNKPLIKQKMTASPSERQGEYETSTDLTGSIIDNGVVKQKQAENETEKAVPVQTFPEITQEATGSEDNEQREKNVNLPAGVLSYNDNAEVSEELEVVNEKQRSLAQIAIELQGWLEPATDSP